ncbi:3-oxoacyl-ACP reductase [Angustibacter sp. Root456]|uniref:3-oxoacyl-ACP reductase n=1 Tax=Angustibacter sp. Root456 TaxID=1736539 RepID=UPI0006F8F5E9|nr:3-oxoacyl-ACP reductase [Angustibacter sp. Root456]KQX61727.1 3-ketoacyl-ACP reductase [Angustibacter sp. Root456]
MSDRYAGFVNGSFGKALAQRLGLPRPVELRRYEPGQPLLVGPALVAGVGTPAPVIDRVLSDSATSHSASDERLGAVVFDACAATDPGQLESLREVLAPALRRLLPCARLVVLGRPPESASTAAAAAAQRALEGIVRSVGKELRAGSTANLVLVDEGADDAAESTLRFLLSSRSAYVDGQVVRVTAAELPPTDWQKPLQGKVAVVTGAARGIGEAIAEVLARDGATVVAVDVPAAGEALMSVANRVGGTALQLDVTAADAGRRIADHAQERHGGLDVVVHNAGITRDKLLVNTDADRWGSVLAVNLEAQLRIDDVLLGDRALAQDGRVVSLSSTSGIAGNRGQANYAASKAGVIGMVQARAREVADRGITYNAVAPGFIETVLTARIPLATREVGRRINSLSQGGLPVDVAEAVAWFAQPGSAGVTGQVVRVCGQSQLGA